MMGPFLDPDNHSEGFSVHTFNLCHWLSKDPTLEITLITSGDKDRTIDMGGYRLIVLQRNRSFRYIPAVSLFKLHKQVRKAKPDLIHVQGTAFNNFLAYALFLAPKRVPKIVTVHGRPVQEGLVIGWLRRGSVKMGIMTFGERMIPRRFDHIVFVTSGLRDEYRSRYRIGANTELSVIPNGVDPSQFQPNGRLNRSQTIPGGGSSQFRILAAKALTPANGQQFIIRALPEILRKAPNAHLVIAGEGPERGMLQRLAAQLGVEKQVSFVGKVPNNLMPELFQKSEVLVVPAVRTGGIEEGSSIVVLEAMIAGVPVVVSAVGGLVDSVANNRTGILVPERDARALAEAVLTIHDSPAKAKDLSMNAREFVLADRTWEKISRLYLDAYAKTVSRRD